MDWQSHGKTPFSELLVAVFNSILEVFFLCLSGYLLARRGIFDKKTQKQLNRLNVTLFTPALLFSKVAFFLTPEKLKELWIIPIWFMVVSLLSMVVGYSLGALFHLRRSQRSFVMAAAMFMNSNSLPIALMQSLVVSVPDLAWGTTDNRDAMLGRALTYLTVYSTLGMVLRYSYGVNLLSRADTVTALPSTTDVVETESSRISKSKQRDLIDFSEPPSVGDVGNPSRLSIHSDLTTNQAAIFAEPNGLRPLSRDAAFHTFPNTPNDSAVTLARYDSTPVGYSSESDGDSDEASGLVRHRLPRPNVEGGQHLRPSPIVTMLRLIKRQTVRIWITIRTFMTAPLWAALFSLLVAFIDPLKHGLEHHFQPLNRAINSAGKCAIPLTLVVLGAYFYSPPPEGDNGESVGLRHDQHESMWHRIFYSLRMAPKRSSQPKKPPCPGETKTVVLAILARMILTPLLLVPFLILASRYDWHAVFDDPVFVTVNTILLCSPPALTLAQITAAVSGETYERLLSQTIFWSYCAVTPPVSIGCVLLGLWLAQI